MVQNHEGSGDNVAGNKITINGSSSLKILGPANQLPFERPNPHLPRKIFKKQNTDNLVAALYNEQKNCDLLIEINEHPRIVLLGDAGMGKSTELRWICHDLKDTEEYLLIYKRLADYQGHNAGLIDLPLILSEQEGKIVLILDGLDEVSLSSAKQEIEKFTNDYPSVKVIVSCRSNAYANTLENFTEYYLGPLTFPDIRGYLQSKLGDFCNPFLEFWRVRYPFNPTQLIDNPFFLTSICEYIQDKGNKVPGSLGDVFEHLIAKSLELRLKDFSSFGEGDLNELRKSCRKSLEKLAFVMEFCGQSAISKTELKQLISDTHERDVLLGKSSLIEVQDDNSWRFAHNNFQEYLAARVLSRAKKLSVIKRAIAAKPDYERLKWSWINALSFLLGLWKDDSEIKTNLLNWLAIEDLDPLIKIGSFEREKISLSSRERIFRLAFESCEKKDINFGSHHYHYWDLAAFAESPITITYLLNKLKSPKVTMTIKNNVFVLLKSMSGDSIPYEKRKELRSELFKHVYDFKINTSLNRHYALEALIKLFHDLTTEESINLVKTFFYSKDSNERKSAYHVIKKQKLQVVFMEQLIRRISKSEEDNWGKDIEKLKDDDWQIENCFKDLDDESTIVSYFEEYGVITNDRWDVKWKILHRMLENLTTAIYSKIAIRKIFEAMKHKFSRWLASPIGLDKDLIFKFIERNNLGLDFYKFCVDQGEIIVSVHFLSNDGISYVVDKFRKGLCEKTWILNYLYWCDYFKSEMLPFLIQQLNEQSIEPFHVSDLLKKRDYELEDRQKLRMEKQLSLNLEYFTSTIEEIFLLSGRDKFGKNEIYELQISDEDFFGKYPHSLLRFIDDFHSRSISELKDLARKNWDWFFICMVKDYLILNRKEIEKTPELALNPKELELVKTWCDNHQQVISWNNQLTEADVVFAWFTIVLGFNHYPENLYFQMLSSGLQYHIGTDQDNDIIYFILNRCQVPVDRVKEKVLDILKNGCLYSGEVLPLFKFIRENHIKEALSFIPNYVEG